MSQPLNPSEKSASQKDYEKKFDRSYRKSEEKNSLKNKELGSDNEWLQNRQKATDNASAAEKKGRRKQRLRLRPPKSRFLKKGSAFLFIFGLIAAGVWYTSILAPNILLVNTKEIYTNDLADATTALQIYTQISYLNKIGPQSGTECNPAGGVQPIKCRLTTFSRYEKLAFERQGWIVIAQKIGEDNRDNQDTNDDLSPESRFKVLSLLPPNYKETLSQAVASGITTVDKLVRNIGSDNTLIKKAELESKKRVATEAGKTDEANYYQSQIDQLEGSSNSISDAGTILQTVFPDKDELEGVFREMVNPQRLSGALELLPIASGPQLWLYSQLSPKAKERVWSVFNPRSSFFHDARFVERLKSRYNMSKAITVGGNNELAVNDSFDTSVGVLGGGIDIWSGQPDPTSGTSLAALSTPLNKNALPDAINDTVGLIGSVFAQPPDTAALQNLITQDDLNAVATKGPIDLLTDLNEKVSTLLPGLDNLQKIIDKQLPFPAKLQVAANLLTLNSYSYTDLLCSWYTIGKISTNALIRAKASTSARFALQYLKAADSIKAGSAQEVATNVLAGKLAQDKKLIPFGPEQYGGGTSSTDSLIYRMTAFGDILPGLGDVAAGLGALNDTSSYQDSGGGSGNSSSLNVGAALGSFIGQVTSGFAEGLSIVAYNLSAYESVGTMAASWAQVLPNAAAFGGVTGASAGGGILLPPPVNLAGLDRKYCLSGETFENKNSIKGLSTNDTKCDKAVLAMAPVGMQAALAGAAELARRTCPPTNALDDNPIRVLWGDWRGPVQYVMWPSKLIVQSTMTPYIATWFGVNTMLTAAATQLLYTSQATGFDANYALFAGMGELLGDMAMSRGLMPSNPIDMQAYLHLGELLAVKDGKDDIAKEQGRKNPFDPYNKFSFVGSLARMAPQFTSNNTPLYAVVNNIFGTLSSATRQIASPESAKAFYFSQPNLLTFDNNMLERELQYIARLSTAFCPVDFEAVSIGVTPDIMCNVRYSMPFDDLRKALDLNGLISYMTTPQPGVYEKKKQELDIERIPRADPDIEYPTGILDLATALPWFSQWQGPAPASSKLVDLVQQRRDLEVVSLKPMIDPLTGKVTPGSEYDKYLTYCVNRLDPWGRSGVAARYDDALDSDISKRRAYTNRTNNLDPYVLDSGTAPYAKQVDTGTFAPRIAITATQDDLDWYTGKKCARLTDQPDMLSYFRAYTTLCSVDGSMSGKVDCSEQDYSRGAYSNPFYLNNDILFTSWY